MGEDEFQHIVAEPAVTAVHEKTFLHMEAELVEQRLQLDVQKPLAGQLRPENLVQVMEASLHIGVGRRFAEDRQYEIVGVEPVGRLRRCAVHDEVDEGDVVHVLVNPFVVDMGRE